MGEVETLPLEAEKLGMNTHFTSNYQIWVSYLSYLGFCVPIPVLYLYRAGM